MSLFGSMSGGGAGGNPVDPIEIFNRAPRTPDLHQQLWAGQEYVLKTWHEQYRTKGDVLVALNTGAGKSTVGVLMAQSLVNEGKANVVYACATRDLMHQTAAEARRLGLDPTLREKGEFSSDGFARGKTFCLTTYHALFNGRSVFKTRYLPEAVIFDDAHVAEDVIRSYYTLTIEDDNEVFGDIADLLKGEFAAIGWNHEVDNVTSQGVGRRISLAPPATAFKRQSELRDALKKLDDKDEAKRYIWPNLADILPYCGILISQHSIEIAPPFIPHDLIPYFADPKIRKIYLSATLKSDIEFVRAFGVLPAKLVHDGDAGNGERLFLFANMIPKAGKPPELVKELASTRKILISVPNYRLAEQWAGIAKPPSAADFTAKLNEFRKAKTGAFVLVGRNDGIDLPDDVCRVMVLDGIPTGASLLERYLWEELGFRQMFGAKLSTRLTQALGRIIRGRRDFGAFLIADYDLATWMLNQRNLALFPDLIIKQLLLGEAICDELGPKLDMKGFKTLVDDMLGRHADWIKMYETRVYDLDIPERVKANVLESSEASVSLAKLERAFFRNVTLGQFSHARAVFQDAADKLATTDQKTAAWYSLWLGATFEYEGDQASAESEYQKARARLNKRLPVRMSLGEVTGEYEPITPGTVAEKLGQLAQHASVRQLHKFKSDLFRDCAALWSDSASSAEVEEATRQLGGYLGFQTSRPDNEVDQGPDVEWHSELEKVVVGFELKTDMGAGTSYSKDDVGQALNHEQWLKSAFEGYGQLGVLMVGHPERCTDAASPSDGIHRISRSALKNLFDSLFAMVADLSAMTIVERMIRLKDIEKSGQWTLTAIVAGLNPVPLKK